MTFAEQRALHPSLDQLLGGYFYPYFEDHALDPGQPLDTAITVAAGSRCLEEYEHDLAGLLAISSDEERATENLMPWLSQTGVPDGPTYREFLVGTLSRVRQAVKDPSSIPDPGSLDERPRPPRVTKFLDEDTANAAATTVLRAHEAPLRAWADENHSGWRRQHYYVPDTGRTTGYALTQDDPDTRQEVRGCVVVMKRDHQTGSPFILTAYPETALATTVRDELPDLPHLFGAYLGQDCYTDGGPLGCQTNFQASTADPARSRVRDQLDELLLRSDEDLRADVEALGCYVLPTALRAYVMRIRWRLDAYDWRGKRAPGNPQGTGTTSS